MDAPRFNSGDFAQVIQGELTGKLCLVVRSLAVTAETRMHYYVVTIGPEKHTLPESYLALPPQLKGSSVGTVKRR